MSERLDALEVNLRELLGAFVESQIENHAFRSLFYSRGSVTPEQFAEFLVSARARFSPVVSILATATPDSFVGTLQTLRDIPEK